MRLVMLTSGSYSDYGLIALAHAPDGADLEKVDSRCREWLARERDGYFDASTPADAEYPTEMLFFERVLVPEGWSRVEHETVHIDN